MDRLKGIEQRNEPTGFHVDQADVRWLIDELRADRVKRAQCEDTIASLLAECKRLNAENERLESQKASVIKVFDRALGAFKQKKGSDGCFEGRLLTEGALAILRGMGGNPRSTSKEVSE